LEETSRMGGKVIISSRKGNIDQSGCPSNFNIHDELLQTPSKSINDIKSLIRKEIGE